MWTDRIVELVDSLGRYALSELGDVAIIRIVQRPSGHRLHILHSLQLPLESSTQYSGEDGLADACIGAVNL